MARSKAWLLFAVLLAGCGAPVQEEPPEKEGPGFLNMGLDVKYVGQETCRECHFEEFSTTSKTGMGRAFYPMTPEESVEDFTASNEFVVTESSMHYRMLERDGKFLSGH